MNKHVKILEQNVWEIDQYSVNRCMQDMHADVVIIGGGMAGLSAAQAWHERGKKVIVLEQWYCGAGATGKSSGFVTPNAELSFNDFAHRYNGDVALQIWNLISGGVENIRSNIQRGNFKCDYQDQDTLIVANSLKDVRALEAEHHKLAKFGYQTRFYNQHEISSYVGSDKYFGGVVYEKTFGINGYTYCQEMKKYLQNQGVWIFEETPVLEIGDHVVSTHQAKISADYIVVCTDRFAPELGLLKQELYHAQTFIMASTQLCDEQIKSLFPQKNFMCWDTDLIYQYFRITGDNRLLLGGGDFASSYASSVSHDYLPIRRKLLAYAENKFPQLQINFEYAWSGLMGISKDIVPVAGVDKDKPYVYYVSAASGLSIAAALGGLSASRLLDCNDQFEPYFSPYRKFLISGWLQSLLGNKLSCIVSNLIKKNIP